MSRIREIPEHPTHAVKSLRGHDGEPSAAYGLAFLREGQFYWHEDGRPVVEYEGEELLHAWPLSEKTAITPDLIKVGEQIRIQDNRGTRDPLFCVFELREIVAHEDYDHDRIVWVDDEGIEATDPQHRRLEALHNDCRETGKWRRLAMKDVPQLAAACFTEQGCMDYLDQDGHNLRKPYIYAASSFRNSEYLAVRSFLAGLTDQPS